MMVTDTAFYEIRIIIKRAIGLKPLINHWRLSRLRNRYPRFVNLAQIPQPVVFYRQPPDGTCFHLQRELLNHASQLFPQL